MFKIAIFKKKNKENKQVIPQGNTLSTFDPKSFKESIEREKEIRNLLKQYIADSLKEGEDYGKIHIAKNCFRKPWEQDGCPDGHFSKNCLFKSGSEKFCSLLKLRPEFEIDRETKELMSDTDDTYFFYLCKLKKFEGGEVVSEGRGACGVKEKKGQVNVAIKIALKRAQTDAVLRIGLSDTFTQDIDEMNQEKIEYDKPIKTNRVDELYEISPTSKPAVIPADPIIPNNKIIANEADEGIKKIELIEGIKHLQEKCESVDYKFDDKQVEFFKNIQAKRINALKMCYKKLEHIYSQINSSGVK